LAGLLLAGTLLTGAFFTAQGALAPASASAQEEGGGGGENQAAAAKPQKGRMQWFIESSGWIGAVILLLSIYFIATVSRLFVELRPQISVPPDVVKQCQELLEKRDYKGVFTVVQEDQSEYSQIISAGMTELSSGLAEARDAMERVSEVLTVEMERKISMLAVLGTLGPMIGLLGTLKGMISSFSVIALSGANLDASQVAGGISEALLLTFEGVALSVPAIYFYAVFRNRVATISSMTLLQADEFMRRMFNAARGKAGAGDPAAKVTK
jgi:biopolymer transport protein ExbB